MPGHVRLNGGEPGRGDWINRKPLPLRSHASHQAHAQIPDLNQWQGGALKRKNSHHPKAHSSGARFSMESVMTKLNTADPGARLSAFAADVAGMLGAADDDVAVMIRGGRQELIWATGRDNPRTSFSGLDHDDAVKAAKQLLVLYATATQVRGVDRLVAEARMSRARLSAPVMSMAVPPAVPGNPFYPAGHRAGD